MCVLFARGLLRHLYTRLYSPMIRANGGDPLLAAIEDEAVRGRLLARASGAGRAVYRFDIVMPRGEKRDGVSRYLGREIFSLSAPNGGEGRG